MAGVVIATLLSPVPSRANISIVSEIETLASNRSSNQASDQASDQINNLRFIDRTLLTEKIPAIETRPSTRLFLERADLEAWARDTIGVAEARGRLTGAGVAVFRPEGSVIVKGFGYGDFEKRDPVHPSVTYLPAAQLGDLLVAELLVELEATGRLNLGDRASNYLTRIALPPAYRHLTIRDLFGSETGLTTSIRGTHLAPGQTEPEALGHIKSMLNKSAPERQNSAPSSPLASALASLIVEDVSGQKIEKTLSQRLADKWGATAWFNTAGSRQPGYTSQHHRISRFGETERMELYATSPGFVASQGIYLTLNDITRILASQLKGLEEKSPLTERVVALTFAQKTVDGTAEGELDNIEILQLQGSVNASSVHIVLVPDLEIGLVAVVNSAPRTVDLAPGRGKEKILPPLSASDIVENFLQTFIPSHKTTLALPSEMDRPFEDVYTQTSRALIGSDTVLKIFSPLSKKSSVNGLMVLFLLSAVLQFALLASARWPTVTGGQRAAKWLGMASVVTMTAALTLPVVLLVIGHSRTLIDPLYLISRWAFPIAGLMATVTLMACLIGWKQSFWGDEGDGFKRRLCFTAGSLGVFSLAVVSWQLDLIAPVF